MWFYILAVAIAVAALPFYSILNVEANLPAAVEQAGIEPKTDFITVLRIALAAPVGRPIVIHAILSTAAPTIAAFIVASIAFGTRGAKHLIKCYRPWSKDIRWQYELKIWGICVLTLCAMSLVTAGIRFLTAPQGRFEWNVNLFSFSFVISLLTAMFLDIGGLCEQVGWHGFAQPLLQKQLNPLKAALLLGLLWGMWHLPMKPDALAGGFTYSIVYFAFFVARLILLSVIMNYFVNLLGGAALIAVAIHGLNNDSLGLQGGLVGQGFLADNSNLGLYVFEEVTLSLPILANAKRAVVFVSGRNLGLTGSLKSRQR